MKRITETNKEEVQVNAEEIKTRSMAEIDKASQTADADMKRITETNREKIQADADTIKNRSITEINKALQTAGTETQRIVTESTKGETHTAITHFEKNLQQTSQATLSETERKLKGIAQEEIQSATTTIKTHLEGELNKATQIITDTVTQHLEILKATNPEHKDIYTVTLQFDSLDQFLFITWGVYHENLKTKGTCLKVRESQFEKMEIFFLTGKIGGTGKPLARKFCTFEESSNICEPSNYNIIKKIEDGEPNYFLEPVEQANNDPHCIKFF